MPNRSDRPTMGEHNVCDPETCGRCGSLCMARLKRGGWCIEPEGHEGPHMGIGLDGVAYYTKHVIAQPDVAIAATAITKSKSVLP